MFYAEGFVVPIGSDYRVGIVANRGSMFLTFDRDNVFDVVHERATPLEQISDFTNFAGFGYGQINKFRPIYLLAMPIWLLIAIVLAISIHWMRRFRNQPLEGHCRACGYDLRATPNRCPECGLANTNLD